MADLIKQLVDRGVVIPSTGQVWIDESVNVNRIEPGVVLHPGTRIEGSETSIGPDSILGEETPVTLRSCILGQGVRLKGGYHEGAVYWDKSEVGSAAHIRPGTILEEEASCAHGVGLKQTVFLPFMVAGSLINFCDALMAGGTNRNNHSEIGSGYIHFNFTPRGDKATPSLIGDVPRGVLLNQHPIFLGGQGGLIGPAKITYGTTLAAGVMQRSDILEENQLVYGGDTISATSRSFDARIYGKIQRVLLRNLEYLGNIQALRVWYKTIREPFAVENWQKHVLAGGLNNLGLIYNERVKRLSDLTRRLEISSSLLEGETIQNEQLSWVQRWPSLEQELVKKIESTGRDSLKAKVMKDLPEDSPSYMDWIKGLSMEQRDLIQSWLESVIEPFTGYLLRGDDS